MRLVLLSFDVVPNLKQFHLDYWWLCKWCFGMGLVGDRKMIPQYPAFTFLDRMVKACNIRPLNRLDGPFDQFRQTVAKEMERMQRQASEHEIDEYAKKKVEERRVIANVIWLAVVISVHLSKGEKKYKGRIIW